MIVVVPWSILQKVNKNIVILGPRLMQQIALT